MAGLLLIRLQALVRVSTPFIKKRARSTAMPPRMEKAQWNWRGFVMAGCNRSWQERIEKYTIVFSFKINYNSV
jgi:hypothetical protein